MDRELSLPVPKAAIFSALLCLSPLFGVGVTAFDMIQAFSAIAADSFSDPTKLSASLSLALWSTAIGLVFGLIGFALGLYVVIRLRFRRWWLLVPMIIFGVIIANGMIGVTRSGLETSSESPNSELGTSH